MTRSDEEKRKAVKALEKMYEVVGPYSVQAATKSRRIDLFILVVSVVTSGSLWLLLTPLQPTLLKWIAAFLSTVSTGLSLYQKEHGPKRALAESTTLLRDIGDLLAEVRADENFDSNALWHRYKFILAAALPYPYPDKSREELESMIPK